jgi:glucosamine--fructose-6-phosphate aminotransferase (isomerizing)
MTDNDTLMAREAHESAEVLARQHLANEAVVSNLAATLRAQPPRFVVTCARGSSDHAAAFAKYVFETQLGVLTASVAPSIASVYGAAQQWQGALFLAISQSGMSPDLICNAQAAKAAGARVVVMVNVVDSPLAALADTVIPLHAGPERSVAATKRYVATLGAVLHLCARWHGDTTLGTALEALPDALRRGWDADWSALVDGLAAARGLFVVGRGFGMGIALEAALKFKETCGLHAEAFSTAEVQHGPMALVRAGFPILAFSQSDETRRGIETVARDFLGRGACMLLAGAQAEGAIHLPVVTTHPVIEPILMIQSFYRMAATLAIARGFNPDVPPHLRKVTETL